MMKLSANFWFRVFAVAFLIGCLTTWPIFLAVQEYFRALTQAQLNTQGISSLVVSSAFVDLSIPGQQPIALNGFWSAVFISIFGSLTAGIGILIFAALYHLLFGKRLIKKLSHSEE